MTGIILKMKSLPIPDISPDDSYNTCISGISDFYLRTRFEDCSEEHQKHAQGYFTRATNGELCTIHPINHVSGEDPLIFANIYKSELINLYDYYLLKKRPARNIYDEIKLSANDKCPYCGGIGAPSTLDHYLPKSRYPQFSVLPTNLLPCCRDCNTGSKNTTISTQKHEQILHPYFDENHFFNQQWVYAQVIQDEPCSIKYFVNPPEYWNDIDKGRVFQHFSGFNLAYRYNILASEELSILIDQRITHMQKISPQEFSEYLSSIGNTTKLFINHWKKVMYRTLALDDWFCTNEFS